MGKVKLGYLVLSLYYLIGPVEGAAQVTSDSLRSGGVFPSPSEKFYNVSMRTNSLGVGGVILADEYLSPLRYGGWGVSYTSESNQFRYKSLSRGVPLTQQLLGNIPREMSTTWLSQRHLVVSLGHSKNPAGNATISTLQARLSVARQRCLYRGKWGRVYGGPGYTLGVSGLYSSRNGNNPATLKLDASLGIAISYSYRLPWDSFPALIRVSSRTDLIGVQWGQEYGESYYELYYLSEAWKKRFGVSYVGNSWGQEFRLGVDLPLWDRLVYNIGYRFHHKSWTHLGLYNRLSEHTLSLGLTSYLRPAGGRKWTHTNNHSIPF